MYDERGSAHRARLEITVSIGSLVAGAGHGTHFAGPPVPMTGPVARPPEGLQGGAVGAHVGERQVPVAGVPPSDVAPWVAHDQVPAAREGGVQSVAEGDDGVAVRQPRPFAIGRRNVHRVDPQDVRHRRQFGRRPPPVEGHGASLVERLENPGELVPVATRSGVELLDRVLDELLVLIHRRRGHASAHVLQRPLPWRQPGEPAVVDDEVAQVDDRWCQGVDRQRTRRERIRLHGGIMRIAVPIRFRFC